MDLYGIVGKPLEHSFSKRYFTQWFEEQKIDARYEEWAIDDIRQIASLPMYKGINVTLPYKEQVIPYLDEIDITARHIGAVNVVKRLEDGRLKGYNTDVKGFIDSLYPLLQTGQTHALILGTGGASKAVDYGLRSLGLRTTFVSRNQEKGITYEQLNEKIMTKHTVIVNCTPLGMYPNVDSCPAIPYEYIGEEHLLFDLVYNPELTMFLRKGQEQGATIKNGLDMLIGQAKAAWEIWEEGKEEKTED